MAADTATAPGSDEAAWRTLQLPLRPRDRRVPRHRQADRLPGARRPGHHRPLLHLLHADRGHPQHPRLVPHVVLVLRVDRGHLQRPRRVRLAAGVQDRQARAVQRRHLRPADHRSAGRHRRPAVQDRVAVRHGHLPARPGRGRHPGGHPGPGPRLQPAARPSLGHGLLDRRPGGRQPDHLDRRRPHARPLPQEPRADGWKSQFIISGVHLPRGVRARAVLPEGPVVAAARPADGERAGPRPHRGQGPRPHRAGRAGRHRPPVAPDPQVGPRRLGPRASRVFLLALLRGLGLLHHLLGHRVQEPERASTSRPPRPTA